MRRLFQLGVCALVLAICFAGLFALPTAAAGNADAPVLSGGSESQQLPPQVAAGAYLVMDADTGQVLVAKNADQMSYPASTTKILTMGLALEYADFWTEGDTQITVSNEAINALIPRASMIALGRGEVASLRDLLYATRIESANDAAHALAEYVSGSMDAFSEKMNDKAAELGLTGSHFTNASGQPDANHFTTAYDMAEITRWALQMPGFRELFAATTYQMAPTNMQPAGRIFRNSNLIMEPYSNYYCQGVTGSKTGFTDQAQYTLVTTAKRGDTELICVVLYCGESRARYTATNDLLDYCFDNFRRVEYSTADVPAVPVPVYAGSDEPLGEIEVKGGASASFLLHNSLALEDVEFEAEVPDRYVIGHDFAPQLQLRLAERPVQQGVALATLPMTWTGLEEVLASSSDDTALEQMAEDHPVLFWAIVIGPALFALVVAGRMMVKRGKQDRRRKKRLASARAQLPVRIAERPQPARRPAQETAARASGRPPARGEAQRREVYRSQGARYQNQTGPRAGARNDASRPAARNAGLQVIYRTGTAPRRSGQARVIGED